MKKSFSDHSLGRGNRLSGNTPAGDMAMMSSTSMNTSWGGTLKMQTQTLTSTIGRSSAPTVDDSDTMGSRKLSFSSRPGQKIIRQISDPMAMRATMSCGALGTDGNGRSTSRTIAGVCNLQSAATVFRSRIRASIGVTDSQRPRMSLSVEETGFASKHRQHGSHGSLAMVDHDFSVGLLEASNPLIGMSGQPCAVSAPSAPPSGLAAIGGFAVTSSSGWAGANRSSLKGTTGFGCTKKNGHFDCPKGGPGILLKVPPNKLRLEGAKPSATWMAMEKENEVSAVRDLGRDKPQHVNQSNPNNSNPQADLTPATKLPHDVLMGRLKGRAARLEAENTKVFLAQYRSDPETSHCDHQSDRHLSSAVNQTRGEGSQDHHLDHLLSKTMARAEQLQQSVKELELGAQEAERTLDKAQLVTVQVASDAELANLNPFERSRLKLQEDKINAEVQDGIDLAAKQHALASRKLQSELFELRDQKVLLEEFRRARLERVQGGLATARDGSRLRHSVRKMIRLDAQRIIQKLEGYGPPLENWMREVLVNMCHVEIKIEDMEKKVEHLREKALKPLNTKLAGMTSAETSQRFDELCRKTQDRMKSIRAEGGGTFGVKLEGDDTFASGDDEKAIYRFLADARQDDLVLSGIEEAPITRNRSMEEMSRVELEVNASRRLLSDMRQNVAAIVCNQMRQDEKNLGANVHTVDWGWRVMSLLVSEEFAKNTMKEVKKNTPQGRLLD